MHISRRLRIMDTESIKMILRRKKGLKMKRMGTKEQWMQNKMVVCLGALVCCALWGSAFPCIKIGYRFFDIGSADTAAQILFAGCRFTLAGILTVVMGSAISGRFLYPRREELGKLLCLGMLQTVLQYLFFYIGLAHTSGVKASIIEAMNVFVAILVASLIFRQESLTWKKTAGCLIGFAGVVLINLNGMNMDLRVMGEGFIFISTIAYAFSAVLIKRFSAEHNPVMLSGYQFIMGGLVLIAAGTLMGGRIRTVSGPALGLLFYLAFLSAVAYTLWGILLKYNPVSRVSVFGFMNPVFGVLLSAWLLGEGNQAAGGMGIVSLALVCIGIYVVNCGK